MEASNHPLILDVRRNGLFRSSGSIPNPVRLICSSAIIFVQLPDTLRVSEFAPQGLAESVHEVHVQSWKSRHQLLL